MTDRAPGSWRLSYWVNDINPVNWKTVLVGWMQVCFLAAVMGVWIAEQIVHMRRHEPVDFHPSILDGLELLLASLSGVTLAGRITQRVTDYGYVERKNAGKVAVAQATAQQQAAPQVIAGDGATVTATQPAAPQQQQQMPALEQPAGARRRSTSQQQIVIDDGDDDGLG